MPRHSLTLCATALATLIWGSSYYVATEYLPPDRPQQQSVYAADG